MRNKNKKVGIALEWEMNVAKACKNCKEKLTKLMKNACSSIRVESIGTSLYASISHEKTNEERAFGTTEENAISKLFAACNF